MKKLKKFFAALCLIAGALILVVAVAVVFVYLIINFPVIGVISLISFLIIGGALLYALEDDID